jgi:phosphoserine phosphatase
MPGARELCSFLKGLGWKLVAVSGGFNIITDRLYSELNIDKIFSNDLIFEDNKLLDVTIKVTSDKSASVRSYIEENGFSSDEIVVVVDGANDLKLFDLSSFTVGFCAVDVVRDKADIVIDKKDLSLLIPVIKEKFKIKINS